jgi:hypothetical protein
MVTFRAADVDSIQVKVGENVTFESLRQAVVPPYVLIKPFLELPSFVSLVSQTGLTEDGVHGAIFVFRANAVGNGTLQVGFQDVRTGKIVIRKFISVKAED